MKNIYGVTIKELQDYFKEKNQGKFKAVQIFEWLYKKRVTSFEQMMNVGKKTINDLTNDFELKELELITKKTDIDVSKYLFKLQDGNKIEAVLMNHE